MFIILIRAFTYTSLPRFLPLPFPKLVSSSPNYTGPPPIPNAMSYPISLSYCLHSTPYSYPTP